MRTTARVALDRARRLPASLARTGRWPLTLGIAATLLAMALVPPAPARADDPIDEADEASVSGLEAGQEKDVRFDDVRLKKGEHRLMASVDAKGGVGETDEENDDRKVTARCTGGD